MFSEADRNFMARALELAHRGLYTTMPNPRVGCVLVKDGEIVGEGWHERAGEAHAEVYALRAAGDRARGATAYVTLEPCAHQARTPPCSGALLEAKVARVFAAMEDPNPLVCGRGLAALRGAGVQTHCGLMEHEAGELNVGFVSRMTRGRPWIRMKIAASLDGRTAAADGRSQWITGPEAQHDGHLWRARACAILTGIGTVKNDDPQLTVRGIALERQPLKVIVDSRLETPPDARVLSRGTLVAAAREDATRTAALAARGAEVVTLPHESGKVDLGALVHELGRREVNELHVEAGHNLNGSLLRERLVDELLLYMAPHLLGDDAPGMFHLPGIRDLSERRELDLTEVTRVGGDLRVIARFKN